MKSTDFATSDETGSEADTSDEGGLKRAPRKQRLTGREVALRVAAMAGRMPKYLRLAYRLASDRRLGTGPRALPLAGAAYVVSPVDPIPGVIPILGQLDCLAVMLLSLRQAVRLAPPEIAAEHLEATGVTMAKLDTDVATVGEIARWLALKAARGLGRLAGMVARLAFQGSSGALATALGDRPASTTRTA